MGIIKKIFSIFIKDTTENDINKLIKNKHIILEVPFGDLNMYIDLLARLIDDIDINNITRINYPVGKLQNIRVSSIYTVDGYLNYTSAISTIKRLKVLHIALGKKIKTSITPKIDNIYSNHYRVLDRIMTRLQHII